VFERDERIAINSVRCVMRIRFAVGNPASAPFVRISLVNLMAEEEKPTSEKKITRGSIEEKLHEKHKEKEAITAKRRATTTHTPAL
jgi:hypothetical protein